METYAEDKVELGTWDNVGWKPPTTLIAQPATPERVVVCAANKYGEDVFIGVRHFCPIMRISMEGRDIPAMRRVWGEVQGFIDQHGVFMNRTEALAVATAAGQINTRRQKTNPTSILFSEDIY